MLEFKFNFKNNGTEIHNDVVYDHLFDLHNNSYIFLIQPKTEFWRFGIRLSKNDIVEFYHPENRYKDPNPDFPDIHLGVGDWNNIRWTFSNKLHLAQYYLEKHNHLLNSSDAYIPLSTVVWKIQFDAENNLLSVSHQAKNCPAFSTNLEIGSGFKYFKVFAWADKIDFEIDCLIKAEPLQIASSRTGVFRLLSKPDKNLLDSDKLVRIFKELIMNSQDSDEQFFALFGRWGRGKTHFWNLLKGSLNSKDSILFHPIEFQAWKYQDTPAIWAYLYDEIQNHFNKQPTKWYHFKKWFEYYQKLIKLNVTRGNFKPFFKLGIRILFSILSLTFLIIFLDNTTAPEWLIWLKSHYLFSSVILAPVSIYSVLYFLFSYINKYYKQDAKKLLANSISKVNFESYLGLQHEIQKELIFLLKTWMRNPNEGKRLLLFIDDIDRCSEDKIILIVDYIRVLLHHPEIQNRMTVVAAIDERILINAIRNKYINFIKDTDPIYPHLCREYLDKLFIASLKLGPLTNLEKDEILDGFTDYFLPQASENEELQASGKPKQEEPIRNLETSHKEADGGTNGGRLNVTDKDSKNIFFLENWEQSYLKKILINADATPRSVRVFVIRYMLGKRLIEKPLNDESKEYLLWSKQKIHKQYFASQLFRFCFQEKAEDLQNAYEKFSSLGKSEDNIIEEVKGIKFLVNPNLNSVIYQALTMIVPY